MAAGALPQREHALPTPSSPLADLRRWNSQHQSRLADRLTAKIGGPPFPAAGSEAESQAR